MEKEQYYLDLVPLRKRYNIRPIVESNKGVKVSDETKLKMAGRGCKVIPPLISPEGVIYTNEVNLTKFSKDRNLNVLGMRALVHKREMIYKGWRLLENADYVRSTCKLIPPLIDPLGNIYEGYRNIDKFSKEHNLCPKRLGDVISGKKELCKGWRLVSGFVPKPPRVMKGKPYPKLVSPEGVVYEEGYNLAKFCRNHNLSHSSMLLLIHNDIHVHKGWELLNYNNKQINGNYGKPIPPLKGDDGLIYSGYFNLKKFCREHKLDVSCMADVIHKKVKFHKGWCLLENKDEIPPKIRKPYPLFVSPCGEIYENCVNLKEFCKEHNLDVSCMHDVISKKVILHKGWRLLENKDCNLHNIGKPIPPLVSPTGEVYEGQYNLSEFCRNNNISHKGMSNVIHGKQRCHKGWRLKESIS